MIRVWNRRGNELGQFKGSAYEFFEGMEIVPDMIAYPDSEPEQRTRNGKPVWIARTHSKEYYFVEV
jgi:hypothetical protein